jgi:uncharacterized circularly permuted ATP-grasp superfamily protein/uncharacterized alpha-E superfamily protein
MTLVADGRSNVAVTTSYDELVTGNGAFRPHWRGLMETWSQLDPQELADRASRVAAQIASTDQMLAHPDHAPETGRSLDLLPLIIAEQEWQAIAAGLVQRARLLDLILADLYGAQRLLAAHKLPAYLVLANPAFLRPLRALKPVDGAPQLHFYAADLVRMPNGEWRVYSDRTQAPAGVGYALHNRNVLARALPEIFRAVHVRPLDSFVELWRGSLRALAARLDREPLSVLYTPGPYNDAYFEHVYLARELGITLVQSADLTVRDTHVYLKTLGGLARVDVIYRRVDGDYCDSLELREDSALGVAGLVEVMRMGHVIVVNAPGAALVEAPGFTAFLPELARELLGEELTLPAVTTWWCGQASALAEVQADIDNFAIYSAFDRDPVPTDPALLSKDQRERFLARLARRPEDFVAREKIIPSVAPCFVCDEHANGALVPGSVVMRAAVLWHDGKWFAMPGGVARVLPDESIYRSALRHGIVSKDVWVLGDERDENVIPAVAAPPTVARHRDGRGLRSRSADDLFWLGRQVERLEAGARQFLATLQRLTSGTMTPRNRAELLRLAEALKRTGWISFPLAATPVDSVAFFEGVVATVGDGVAMRDAIDAVHRLTYSARDQLALSMWKTLNRLTTTAAARFGEGPRNADEVADWLDSVIAGLAAFGGLVAEDMTRGAGWRFLDLGRRIERGIDTCRAVSGVMAGPAGQIEAGARLALDLCNSTSAYLLRYPLEMQLAHVLNFVLADRRNPRALLYQLEHIERHLRAQAASSRLTPETGIIGPLIAQVERASFEDEDGSSENREMTLFPLLDHVADRLMALSDQITRIYFTHTASSYPVDFSTRQIAAKADK